MVPLDILLAIILLDFLGDQSDFGVLKEVYLFELSIRMAKLHWVDIGRFCNIMRFVNKGTSQQSAGVHKGIQR